MKSSKRRLTAILCLTALILTSASCGNTETPFDTTTGDSESVSDTTVETTEERISTGLEPRDFDGYVFRFSNASNEAQPYNNMQLTVEEADGDTLNDAINKRNRAVESGSILQSLSMRVRSDVLRMILRKASSQDLMNSTPLI